MIAFSSVYKATYAEEKLRNSGIIATIRKTPTNISISCSYALFLKTNDINRVMSILDASNIVHSGIFAVEMRNGQFGYRRMSLY